jgi:lipopolysaccharide O-acetyltransferase
MICWKWTKYIRLLQKKYRENRIRHLVAYIGEDSHIIDPFEIGENIYVGSNTTILENARIKCLNDLSGTKASIRIGSNCYLCYNLTILAAADVIIHDNVLIASYVLITTENHGMNPESSIPYMNQPLTYAPIEIGEGTWVGEKVSILPGVKIGKKCIIGTNAVVTHDVPDYSIAVGIPARVIEEYNFDRHAWVKKNERNNKE